MLFVSTLNRKFCIFTRYSVVCECHQWSYGFTCRRRFYLTVRNTYIVGRVLCITLNLKIFRFPAIHLERNIIFPCILNRYCMATIINAAHQFKNIFSTNGYFLIMPDLLRIYSNNQVCTPKKDYKKSAHDSFFF